MHLVEVTIYSIPFAGRELTDEWIEETIYDDEVDRFIIVADAELIEEIVISIRA